MPCPTKPFDAPLTGSLRSLDPQRPFIDRRMPSPNKPSVSNPVSPVCSVASDPLADPVRQESTTPSEAPVSSAQPQPENQACSGSVPVIRWRGHNSERENVEIRGNHTEAAAMSFLSEWTYARRSADSAADAKDSQQPQSRSDEQDTDSTQGGASNDASTPGTVTEASAHEVRHIEAGDGKPLGRKASSGRRGSQEEGYVKSVKAPRLRLEGEGASPSSAGDEDVLCDVKKDAAVPASGEEAPQGSDLPSNEADCGREEGPKRGSRGWSLSAIWNSCRPVAFGSLRRSQHTEVTTAAAAEGSANSGGRSEASSTVREASPNGSESGALEEGRSAPKEGGPIETEVCQNVASAMSEAGVGVLADMTEAVASPETGEQPTTLRIEAEEILVAANADARCCPGAQRRTHVSEDPSDSAGAALAVAEGRAARRGLDRASSDGGGSPSASERKSFLPAHTRTLTRDHSTSSPAGSRYCNDAEGGAGSSAPQDGSHASGLPVSGGASALSSPTAAPDQAPLSPSSPSALSDQTELPAAPGQGRDSEGRASSSQLHVVVSKTESPESDACDEERARGSGEEAPTRSRRRSHRLRDIQKEAAASDGGSDAACASPRAGASASAGHSRKPGRRAAKEDGKPPRRCPPPKRKAGGQGEEAADGEQNEASAPPASRPRGPAGSRRRGRGTASVGSRRRGGPAAEARGELMEMSDSGSVATVASGRGQREGEKASGAKPDSERGAKRQGKGGGRRGQAASVRKAPREKGASEDRSRDDETERAEAEASEEEESLPSSSSSSSGSDDSEYEEEETGKRGAKGSTSAGRRRGSRAAAAAAWRSSAIAQQPQEHLLVRKPARGMLTCGSGATSALSSICGDSAASAGALAQMPVGPAMRIGSLAGAAGAPPPAVAELTALLGGGAGAAARSRGSAPLQAASASQSLLQLAGRSPFRPMSGGRGGALPGVLGGLRAPGGLGAALSASLSGAKSPGFAAGGRGGVSAFSGAPLSPAAFPAPRGPLGAERGDGEAEGEPRSRKGSVGSMEGRAATVSSGTAAAEDDGFFRDEGCPPKSEAEGAAARQKGHKARRDAGLGSGVVAYLPVAAVREPEKGGDDHGTVEERGGEESQDPDALAEIVHISEIDENQRMTSARVVIRKNRDCLIGRDSRECDLVADCVGKFAKMISRRHAVIRVIPAPELFQPPQAVAQASSAAAKGEKEDGAHAPETGKLAYEAYRLCLGDEGSLNGVSVNDVRQKSVFLCHGDIITLGGVGALLVEQKREQPDSPFRFRVNFFHPLPPSPRHAAASPGAPEAPSAHGGSSLFQRMESEKFWEAEEGSHAQGDAERAGEGREKRKRKVCRSGGVCDAEDRPEARGGASLRLACVKVVHVLSEEELRERMRGEEASHAAGAAQSPHCSTSPPPDDAAPSPLQFPLSGSQSVSGGARLSFPALSPPLFRPRGSPLRLTPPAWRACRGAASGGGQLLLSASQEVFGSPNLASPSPSHHVPASRGSASLLASFAASPFSSPRRPAVASSQPTVRALSQSSPPHSGPLSPFPHLASSSLSLNAAPMMPISASQPLSSEGLLSTPRSRVSERGLCTQGRRNVSPLRTSESRAMEIIGEVTVPWNGTIAQVRQQVDILVSELLRDKLFSLSPAFSAPAASSPPHHERRAKNGESAPAGENDGGEAGREGAARGKEGAELAEAKIEAEAADREEAREGSPSGCEPRLPRYELLPSPATVEVPFKEEGRSWVFELPPFNPSANLAVARCFRSLGEGSDKRQPGAGGGLLAKEEGSCGSTVRTVSTVYLRFVKPGAADGEQKDGEEDSRQRAARGERDAQDQDSPACNAFLDYAESFFDPAEDEEDAGGLKRFKAETRHEPTCDEEQAPSDDSRDDRADGAVDKEDSEAAHDKGMDESAVWEECEEIVGGVQRGRQTVGLMSDCEGDEAWGL